MSRLDDKLAALATMSPAQLRGEWLQLFGSAAPPVGHKLLGLAIAHRLQERAKGGLSAKLTREIDAMARQMGKGRRSRRRPRPRCVPEPSWSENGVAPPIG